MKNITLDELERIDRLEQVLSSAVIYSAKKAFLHTDIWETKKTDRAKTA